jgi:cadmium resistance protein CadD (predicted permease)
MESLASAIGIGIAAFAATNVDDVFLLAAFFADPRLARRAVVAGQLLGIGALVAASAAAARLAVAVPPGWVALLGLAPLYLGLSRLRELLRGAPDESAPELHAERALGAQLLAVTAVTLANGGDNLGVYVPLFASSPARVPLFAATFAGMTLVWCALGHALVHNRVVGEAIRRHTHVAVPFVLAALGLYILSGVAMLFR